MKKNTRITLISIVWMSRIQNSRLNQNLSKNSYLSVPQWHYIWVLPLQYRTTRVMIPTNANERRLWWPCFPPTTSNNKEERATSDSKVESHHGALFKVPSHKPRQHRIAPRGSWATMHGNRGHHLRLPRREGLVLTSMRQLERPGGRDRQWTMLIGVPCFQGHRA